MTDKQFFYPLIALLSAGSLFAASITVTEAGNANSYGRTSGVAIDFNTSTPDAAWDTNLTSGQQYSVDSVSLYLNNWDPAGDYYLGVYTGLTQDTNGGGSADTLSGFLGVSSNTVDLANSDGGAKDLVTWNFSGINVTADSTPGSGSGVLYFVFQTGTSALTEMGARPAATTQSFHRIDGTGEENLFSEFLSATIEGSFNDFDEEMDLRSNRPLEFQATVTVIPEPSTFVLMGIVGVVGIGVIRRRDQI